MHLINMIWKIQSYIHSRGASSQDINSFALVILWLSVLVRVDYLPWKALDAFNMWYYRSVVVPESYTVPFIRLQVSIIYFHNYGPKVTWSLVSALYCGLYSWSCFLRFSDFSRMIWSRGSNSESRPSVINKVIHPCTCRIMGRVAVHWMTAVCKKRVDNSNVRSYLRSPVADNYNIILLHLCLACGIISHGDMPYFIFWVVLSYWIHMYHSMPELINQTNAVIKLINQTNMVRWIHIDVQCKYTKSYHWL